MRPYTLYYNEHAGNARKVLSQTLSFWEKHMPTAPPVCTTVQADEMPPTIIIIGGDGTFNTLLNTLPHPENHHFVLLAGGTSNSLYSQLSGSETVTGKLTRWLESPRFIELDLPVLTTGGKSYRFINEASAGFAAAIAHRIEYRQTKRFFNAIRLNELAYIATAFRCWMSDEPVFLSICNNRRISGDIFPCIHADPTDGQIDIYDLSCPRWRLPFELTRLVKAKQDKPSAYVTRQQVRHAEWHFEHFLPIETDGNPLPPAQTITLDLYPKRITVM